MNEFSKGWTGRFSWLLRGLITVLMVSACQNQGPRVSGLPRVLSPEQVTLIDVDGVARPPRDFVKGVAPFGVLLNPDGHSCGVTRLTETIASTASHCVPPNYKSLRLRFSDAQTGELKSAGVQSVKFVGDENSEDIALLELENAEGWDKLPAESIAHLDQIKPTGTVESVVVWGFDETKGAPNVPEGMVGMAFNPRVCSLSPRSPKVGKLGWDGRYSSQDFRPSNKKASPDELFFLDNCSGPIRPGRSGDLVTSYDLGTVYGTLHWIVPKNQFKAREIYLGSLGAWMSARDLAPTEEDAVFSIGTTFEGLLRKHSELRRLF